MRNDVTLFMRGDQVKGDWRLLVPILEVCKANPPGDFPNYAAGPWGPEDTQGLLTQQGNSGPVPIELVGRRTEKGERS